MSRSMSSAIKFQKRLTRNLLFLMCIMFSLFYYTQHLDYDRAKQVDFDGTRKKKEIFPVFWANGFRSTNCWLLCLSLFDRELLLLLSERYLLKNDYGINERIEVQMLELRLILIGLCIGYS